MHHKAHFNVNYEQHNFQFEAAMNKEVLSKKQPCDSLIEANKELTVSGKQQTLTASGMHTLVHYLFIINSGCANITFWDSVLSWKLKTIAELN